MASKVLIQGESTPALERTIPDRAGGDGSEVSEGRAPLWLLLRTREEQEKRCWQQRRTQLSEGESGAE